MQRGVRCVLGVLVNSQCKSSPLDNLKEFRVLSEILFLVTTLSVLHWTVKIAVTQMFIIVKYK